MHLIDKILLEAVKPKFSYSFIQVIAAWQNWGASEPSVLKKLLTLKVPDEFKRCDVPIYRLVGLKNIDSIQSSVGSWSKDLKICKDFLKSDWFSSMNDPEEKTAVILKVIPKHQNIIIDLDSLWNNQEFVSSIKFYEAQKKFFTEGLELENAQKEVVYNSGKLDRNSVYLIWDLKKQKWLKNEYSYSN